MIQGWKKRLAVGLFCLSGAGLVFSWNLGFAGAWVSKFATAIEFIFQISLIGCAISSLLLMYLYRADIFGKPKKS